MILQDRIHKSLRKYLFEPLNNETINSIKRDVLIDLLAFTGEERDVWDVFIEHNYGSPIVIMFYDQKEGKYYTIAEIQKEYGWNPDELL